MKRVGKEISAADRWKAVASDYASNIDSAYQKHRLDVIRTLMPSPIGHSIIDLGCGEGVLMEEAFLRGATTVVGLDIDETMVMLASKRVPNGQTYLGGVEQLAKFGAVDCLIAANVLAYMTDAEELDFYQAAARVVRPGGHLVVTHSNALFDLFTLNRYTVDFFQRHFDVDPSALLTHPDKPSRAGFNVRENPLSYAHKLATYGFQRERQEFINYHALPPLISGENPDDLARAKRDTLNWAESDQWQLMFKCSMFGVRAVKT